MDVLNHFSNDNDNGEDDRLYADGIEEEDIQPEETHSASLPEIGLLCCGACNLSYDRDAVVRRLPELLPEARFVTARSGVRYAALLVVHGCPIACTSEFNIAVPEERRVRMGAPEELPSALDRLRRIICR
ncbi:MAG: hypothetical protein Q4D81_10250 [Eubacteriales bacterium]|nr:hypothetical protein [Eubacteriales bacterium]